MNTNIKMLVEGPFMGNYMYTQQRTCMRHQQVLELGGMMQTLKQFPDKHFTERLSRLSSFNTNLSSNSSHSISNTNSSLVYGAAASGRTGLRNATCPKVTGEVSAFGPKHAEHARRFYQKGIQFQEFQQVLHPSYRPNYRPIPQSNEIVLKVAKISPRPGRNEIEKQKTSLDSSFKLPKSTTEKGLWTKSVDFQANKYEKDLSNAPLFQLLGEITNSL